MSEQNLPDFRKPPVIEVALSVQFEPLNDLHVAHLGLLWSRYKEHYPKTEEHQPINKMIEQFGLPKLNAEQRVEILATPPFPRFWFINHAGDELIQLQQDRFVVNWRKSKDEDPYPRYKSIRERFIKEFNLLSDFLAEEKIPLPIPNQCEVTYVNHIKEGWERFGQVHELMTTCSKKYSDEFLAEAEDIRYAARYAIHDEKATPIGRLHVGLEPAYSRIDEKPLFVMTLIARGSPRGQTLDGVLTFLDIGHEWIVRGFASITTTKMHKLWERLQ